MNDELALLVLLLLLASSSRSSAATPPVVAPPAPAPSLPPAVEPEQPLPPVPPRATRRRWSVELMRQFVREMKGAGVSPALVLLGMAAASEFDAGAYLGNNVGLLMVRRDHLQQVGYPGDPPLYSLDAEQQFPWIAKVLAYRIANAGGKAPTTVAELALLLNPVKGAMRELLRNEAARRATEAKRTTEYTERKQLLDRVLTEG